MSPAAAQRRKGWTRVAFGDVVRQVRDRVDPEDSDLERYVAGEHMDTDDLKIRRWGLIGDGYLGPAFHMRFKPGHVLYGSRRTYLRKVAVADFEGVTANTTFVLESKDPDALLPELLPFIMQTESFHDHSIKQSKGSVNPYINFSDLTWYEFALPPLDEQRRIAEVLGAARSTYESYRRLSAATATGAQAFIAEFLHTVERDVKASTLDEHARVSYGLTVDPGRRRMTEQIPYLRVANVQRGSFDLTEIKTVGRKPEDEAFRLAVGDVLVVEGHADATQIGRAAVWLEEDSAMFHQNHLIRVRCGPGLEPEYLSLIMNSVHGQTYFRRYAKSTSGLNTINSTVVKRYLLPVPSRETQAELVEKARIEESCLKYIARRQDHIAVMTRILLEQIGGEET